MTQHKWHKEIKAWADGALIEKRKESSEWLIAVCPRWEIHEDIEYRIKPHAKCITKDCTNHVNEGKFVGDLCGPCWEYITNGKGIHSQAYRNAQPKEPKYLKVYGWLENQNISFEKVWGPYIGKIKLEVDDDTSGT
jgi:hypothetical protein